MKYLATHMHQWALARTNSSISSHSLPFVSLLTSFMKKPYVYAHRYLSVLAAFRLSNAGLGNKIPLPGSPVQTSCPLCLGVYKLTEAHVLFACPAVRDTRRETGVSLFLTQAAVRGHSDSKSHYLFVAGFDLLEKMLDMENYKQRAVAMSAIKSTWLQIHG